MGKHASYVGGSNIARKIACKGSLYMERQATSKSRTSDAAFRGSCLHRIIESAYKTYALRPNEGEKWLKKQLFRFFMDKNLFYVINSKDVAQLISAWDYLIKNQLLKSINSWVELSLFMDHKFGGTIDLLVKNEKQLHVIDYKFGLIGVEVVKNVALAFYLMMFVESKLGKEVLKEVDKIYFHIVQPQVGNEKWLLDRDWFFNVFCLEVKRLIAYVEEIEKGKTNVRDDLEYGNHCMFCRAKSFCPEFNIELDIAPQLILPKGVKL